jgi:cytochrome c553
MTSLKSAIVLIALCFAGQAVAVGVKGDAAAGKKKATACAACHGLDGNKTLDNTYPKLAGQYPDYLLKALKEYKSGKRVNAIMAGQVQGLSEADLANLAVYYGSLKAEIGVLK